MSGWREETDVFVRALRDELDTLETLRLSPASPARAEVRAALMEAYARLRNARVAAQNTLGWSNERVWRKTLTALPRR